MSEATQQVKQLQRPDSLEPFIRLARFGDMQAMLEMAKEFYDYAELDLFGLSFDRNSFADVLAHYINSPNCVVLVAEVDGQVVGSIAGVLTPWFMNLAQVNVGETWWFVRPEFRGQAGRMLLDAFEAWAAGAGARVVCVAGFAAKRFAVLERLYKRRGYKLLEAHFVKEL